MELYPLKSTFASKKIATRIFSKVTVSMSEFAKIFNKSAFEEIPSMENQGILKGYHCIIDLLFDWFAN
jgi:hypothetical protein